MSNFLIVLLKLFIKLTGWKDLLGRSIEQNNLWIKYLNDWKHMSPCQWKSKSLHTHIQNMPNVSVFCLHELFYHTNVFKVVIKNLSAERINLAQLTSLNFCNKKHNPCESLNYITDKYTFLCDKGKMLSPSKEDLLVSHAGHKQVSLLNQPRSTFSR